MKRKTIISTLFVIMLAVALTAGVTAFSANGGYASAAEVEKTYDGVSYVPYAVGDNLRGKNVYLHIDIAESVLYQVGIKTWPENKDLITFSDNDVDYLKKVGNSFSMSGFFKSQSDALGDDALTLLLFGRAFYSVPDDKDYILSSNYLYTLCEKYTTTYTSEYLSPLKGLDTVGSEFDISVGKLPDALKTAFPNGIKNPSAVYSWYCVLDPNNPSESIDVVVRKKTESGFDYLNYIPAGDVSSDEDLTQISYALANGDTLTERVNPIMLLFYDYGDETITSDKELVNMYMVFYEGSVESVYGFDGNKDVEVSFDVDGNVTKESYIDGATVTMPEAPVKAGYNFEGWKTADGSAFDATAPLTKDVMLTANFSLNAVDVTFATKVPSTVSVNIGDKVTEPEAPEAAVGQHFVGWYSDEALTTAFDFNTVIEAAMTIYPKFEINSYTVTFDAAENATVNYGAKVTAPTAEARTGYTFAGWFLDDALTTAFDFDAAIVANTAAYAKYTINSYTVTFEDGSEEPATAIVNYGAKVTAPDEPTKDGYIFKGWKDADGKAYNFDETIITADTELTADWEATWQTKAVDWLTPNHKWAAPTALAFILALAFGIAIAVKRKR